MSKSLSRWWAQLVCNWTRSPFPVLMPCHIRAAERALKKLFKRYEDFSVVIPVQRVRNAYFITKPQLTDENYYWRPETRSRRENTALTVLRPIRTYVDKTPGGLSVDECLGLMLCLYYVCGRKLSRDLNVTDNFRLSRWWWVYTDLYSELFGQLPSKAWIYLHLNIKTGTVKGVLDYPTGNMGITLFDLNFGRGFESLWQVRNAE